VSIQSHQAVTPRLFGHTGSFLAAGEPNPGFVASFMVNIVLIAPVPDTQPDHLRILNYAI
jgi:hypothetical protein